MKISQIFTLFLLSVQFLCSQEKVPLIQFNEISLKASEFGKAGDYEKTLSLLDKVNKNDSAICSVLVSKSYYLMANKEYDRVLTVIDSGLVRGCHDSRASFYINKLVALIGKEEYSKAIELHEGTISQYPKSHMLWYNYGVALEQMNRVEEAVEAYKEVILINPLYKKAYIQLGNISYKQERFSLALMCFNMVLFLEPDSDDALRILQSLNNLLQSRNENQRNTSVILSEDENAFNEIDLILTNRISLNENYETGNPINLAIVRQNHAFMESLSSMTAQNGFWSEHFVPFYQWIHQNGHFHNFIYTLNFSIGNEEYKKIIEKNREDIIEFRNLALQKWLEFIKHDKREWYGGEREVTFYFNNGVLEGIGEFKGDIPYGPWEFYDKDGRVSAKGQFDQNGKRTGKWNWFYNNFIKKEITSYQDGNMEGESLEYYENGKLKEKSFYKENLLHGQYEYFNNNGAPVQKSTYQFGKRNGIYTSFFPNGKSVEYEIPYHDGEIHGKVLQYFSDGSIKAEIEFQNGLRSGSDLQYNYEGILISKENYQNDLLDGEIIRYHSNGKVLELGAANAGKYEGEWKIYHEDGTVKAVNFYKDGQLTGISKSFDFDGKLHYEYEYKNGDIIAYKFYDKSGEVLKEERKKGGEFRYESYTPSGIIDATGLFDIKGGKNGEWKYFSEYGNLNSHSTYVNNSLEGESMDYYANGQLKSKAIYEEDKLNGYYAEYHKNGQLKSQGWFVDNNRQGEWRTYYVDGTLEIINYYHNGQLHGDQDYFAVDGSLQSKSIYDHGVQNKEITFDSKGKLIDSVLLDKKEPNYYIHYNHFNKVPKHKIEFSYGVKDGSYDYYDFLGNKKIEGYHRNDEAEGDWKWYSDSGKIERIAKYRMGSLHGPVILYYEDGEIKSDSYFKFGLADSTWTTYDENGNKEIVTNYEDDLPHGRKEFYGSEGVLELVRLYNRGKLIGYTFLDQGGKELPIQPIPNGTGIIKAYYPNGKVSREMNYKNGELEGVYKHYDQNGILLQELPYTADEYNGTVKEYHTNGKLKIETSYNYGFKEGKEVEYYSSGKIKKEEFFKNDEKHGPSKSYDSTGKLIKSEIYFDGEVISVLKV